MADRDKPDNPNLELQARFSRLRAAKLRPPRKAQATLIERLSLKQLVTIRRQMPPVPSR